MHYEEFRQVLEVFNILEFILVLELMHLTASGSEARAHAVANDRESHKVDITKSIFTIINHYLAVWSVESLIN